MNIQTSTHLPEFFEYIDKAVKGNMVQNCFIAIRRRIPDANMHLNYIVLDSEKGNCSVLL